MKTEDYVNALNEHLKKFGRRLDESRQKSSGNAAELHAAAEKLWKNCLAAVDHAWGMRSFAVEFAKGVGRGGIEGASALFGHLFGRKSEMDIRQNVLLRQSRLYGDKSLAIGRIDAKRDRSKEFVLENTFLGGESLATYVHSGYIPDDIIMAYKLQYPNLAANHSLIDEVTRLNSHDLVGLVSGIKGKLFELRYLEFLNADHHLPEGFHAMLAESSTQPGWDIKVEGPDDHIAQLIQLKATDSMDYVRRALADYPHIDVTTTSEVQSHLLMQGMSEHVVDSGISNADLTEHVSSGLDSAHIHMHKGLPLVALAFVAWTSFRREDLDIYERSRLLGDRGAQSWMAYLAGGAVAVATQTWWLSIVGSVGSRLVLASGRSKLSRLDKLDQLIRQNDLVLDRMSRRCATSTH